MTPGLPPEPPDWEFVYRALMHGRPRLRPWEIDRLTVPELCLALDQDLETPRPPAGTTPLGDFNRDEHVRRARSMTPRQKGEAKRKRYGYG